MGKEKSISLNRLYEVTKRPKEDIFMKMLWGASRGDITLSQPNPQEFGDITLIKVSP